MIAAFGLNVNGVLSILSRDGVLAVLADWKGAKDLHFTRESGPEQAVCVIALCFNSPMPQNQQRLGW